MSSTSQASFSSRLARGKKLHQFMLTFTDFSPDLPELSSVEFKTMLDSMDTTQVQHTETHHAFSEAALERRTLFTEDKSSMVKRLALINSYIRAKFTKDSQIYTDVNKLVKKIRGEKPLKIGKNPDVETISRSERSYGSQMENFTDLVTLATQLEETYKPANKEIRLVELQSFQTRASEMNNRTALKFAAFKPKIAERQNGFDLLNSTANRIKDMVKSQYGVASSEYKLVKGLSF